jgi:transcriptional regulator with XRE-family HTH domain
VPRVASEAAAYVGKRIVTRRLQLALTQDELAAGSGIDSSNIRAYENGRAMPNVYSLVRIATALQLESGFLLDGLTADLFATAAEDKRQKRS